MLFKKAAEQMSQRLGVPTLRESEPGRKCGWELAREGQRTPSFQVVLEAGPRRGIPFVWIADPSAPRNTRDEFIALATEDDIEIALERVRSHMRGEADKHATA